MKLDTNERSSIIFPSILYILAVGLQCPSLITSGYYRVIALEYIISFILFYALILLVWFYTKSKSKGYLTTSACVLMLGNFSQSLMYYGCGMDKEATVIIERIELFSILVIVSMMFLWGALYAFECIKHKQLILTLISIFVSISMCIIILIYSDDSSNTSTIQSIQPAIIMSFLIIYCFALALSLNINIFNRFIYLLCFGAMMTVLLFKHEWGIPLICYMSCLTMYIFLFPVAKIRFLMLYVMAPVSISAMLLIQNNSLLIDTLNKLKRFFYNEHANQAIRNLKSSGLFGSYTYDYYLPAASTDFALNTSIHYWGFLWAFVFLILFVIGAVKMTRELSIPHGFDFSTNLTSLSFTAFCIIIGYNLLVSIGVAPIVGVQALFCGKSLSVAILSGLLLGAITFDKTAIEKIYKKALNYCERKLY